MIHPYYDAVRFDFDSIQHNEWNSLDSIQWKTNMIALISLDSIQWKTNMIALISLVQADSKS